jgi:hypothetical protein
MSGAKGERRAYVQQELDKPAGTIAWSEHEEVWQAYAKRYGNDQSAERIHERLGFGYYEIVDLIGHEPKTWEAR